MANEKSDRELLELAAKAVGISGEWVVRFGTADDEGILFEHEHGGQSVWNPLTDDGDALRLAVKLNMGLDVLGFNQRVFAHAQGAHGSVEEPHGTDPFAATRRAIVRAAAAIGEQA